MNVENQLKITNHIFEISTIKEKKCPARFNLKLCLHRVLLENPDKDHHLDPLNMDHLTPAISLIS